MDRKIWRARHGDRGALEEIVREHYPRVHALALRMLGDDEAAHDAARETFARALRSLHHYRTTIPFVSWLLAIEGDVVREIYRRERRQILFTEAMEEALGSGDEPDRLISRREDREKVRTAFDRLAGDDKLLLLFILQQNLTPAEVAAALGISVNAVRIRLARALELLRRCVQEHPSKELP